MKMARWVLISLLVLIGAMSLVTESPAEPQKVIEISSKIDSAVVYRDRALVTRIGKTENLVKGTYEILMKDLPVGIQDDSIRSLSNDPENLKVIGLDIKTYQLEKPPEDKIRNLQDQLQLLQDETKNINDTLRLRQVEKEYLDSAKNTFLQSALMHGDLSKDNRQTLPRLSVKEYDEMLTYYTNKLTAISEAINKEELKRRDIDKKIRFIQDELSKLGVYQHNVPRKKSVKISIEVLKDGSYDIGLSYIIYGVHWQPSYDVRVLADKKEMDIIAYGVVSQSSGEDWQNILLSFSTAQPSLKGWMDALIPLYATLPAPQPPQSRHSSSLSMMNKAFLAEQAPQLPQQGLLMDRQVQEQKQEDMIAKQYLPAEAAGTFGNVVFNTPKRVDIPADGTPHRTSLWNKKLPVNFEYVTTPKISPYVYLNAVGIYKAEFPILRGSLNIFMGSDFIGTSFTAGILPDEDFELTLNVDESIRITRKLEEKEEQGPGFLGSTKKITYSFLVKLESYKKEVYPITIFDQIPVSQNKDVTIELGKCSDKPLEEGKDGKLTWKFDMKPKEIKELTFSFSVYVPKDKDPSFYNASSPAVENRQQELQDSGSNLRGGKRRSFK
jgi:uncharacterized protein (TIGR02231 family)